MHSGQAVVFVIHRLQVAAVRVHHSGDAADRIIIVGIFPRGVGNFGQLPRKVIGVACNVAVAVFLRQAFIVVIAVLHRIAVAVGRRKQLAVARVIVVCG